MGLSFNWITDSVAGRVPIVPPDSPAIAFDDETPWSWSQLREAELRYARSLQQAGVERGDRVALLLRNSIDYIVFLLAIGRVGAIAVRLNWRLTSAELQFMLDDSAAKLLVLDAEFSERVADIRDQ